MQRGKQILILFFSISFLLTACDGIEEVEGFVSYDPPIPLYVSVNTDGEVEFLVETDVELPTPIGTFGVGVVLDPMEYFTVQNVLTIRYNGEEHYYDLHGQNFKLKFEAGCYKEITIYKDENHNIFLELVRECPVTIEIDNQSPKNICCVFISPCGSDSWGNCWLADNEIIPSGRNRIFTVAAGCYDILVVNCDDSTACEHYDLQVYTSYI